MSGSPGQAAARSKGKVLADRSPRRKHMDVMVFTPTWETDSGTAIRPETRASVEAQDYTGRWTWEIGLHNPLKGVQSHQNVLAQYQRARDLFLDSDYQALLTVEHDMALPTDAISKLVTTAWEGADLVYGVYLLRHGSLVLNAWEYVGDRNLGESLSIMPRKLARARERGTARVCGCGFGCTLITRPVLEQLPMRRDTGDQWCPDIPLAQDALRAGFVSMARFDVECLHYDKGRWLSPYGENMSEQVPMLALQSIHYAVIAETRTIRAGEVYLIPVDVAEELQRAGYVTPAPKEAETATLGTPEKAVARHAKRPAARRGGL